MTDNIQIPGLLDLQTFCEQGGIRGYTNNPFPAGLFWCATNGHVMALHAGDGTQLPDRLLKELPKRVPTRLLGYAHEAANQQFMPLASLTESLVQIEPDPCGECNGTGKSRRVTCPECDGDGEVDAETDYNTYHGLECKTCGGDGWVPGHKSEESDCENCGGTGKIYAKGQRIAIMGAEIQPQYFDLIRDLVGVEVCAMKFADTQKTLNVGFRQVIGGQVVSLGVILGMRA